MTAPITMRRENAADIDAIRDLTARAFAPMPFSSGTEPAIIDALRRDGDLVLSLVALIEDQIIGHVAISPVTIGDLAGWVGLGPISVEPKLQRRGIARAMVANLRQILADRAVPGIVLIGNPKVYGPMGFRSNGAVQYRDVPPEIVQFLHIYGPEPAGALHYARAFDIS